jgi:hypothetical protein
MEFPRLYDDMTCPLPGYEGYTLRVLINPSGQEKIDWITGNLGTVGCEKCAQLQPAGRGKQADREPAKKRYCEACQAARERFGRGIVAVYGTSKAAGLDFSTTEAALATFENLDMPDELLSWLYMAPSALWEQRQEALKKSVFSSSTAPTPS